LRQWCGAGVLLAVSVQLLWLSGCAGPRPMAPVPAEPAMAPDQLVRFANAERQLKSVDPKARRQSAIALLSMGHPRALKAVLDNIKKANDPAVRVSTVEAIGFCQDHRCFEALLGAMKDPDESVKKAVADALSGFTRPEEVRAMIELVSKETTTDKERTLLFNALGRGLAFEAVPVLIGGLEDAIKSARNEVRAAAWEALKEISGQPLAADPEQWRQWWELNRHKSRENILEERFRTLLRQLDASRDQLKETQEQFSELLIVVKSPDADQPKLLLGRLGSKYAAIKEYAAFRLAGLDQAQLDRISLDSEDTYELFRNALDDPSVELRRDVIKSVVRLKGAYRNTLVLKALQDTDPGVLVEAIDGVAKESARDALGRLIQLLSDEKHGEVREAAANALGKLDLKEAAGALAGALDDESEDVRWFAVESLRKLHAQEVVPQLCDLLLNDKSARVREITASALGDLGQPAAVRELRKALGDKNQRVQLKAVAALQTLADDDYERMTIIADDLAQHKYLDAAAEVLRRALEKFGENEDLKSRLIETRTKLAGILKAQKDFAGAAGLYLELDELTGGTAEIRQSLVDCWLEADEGEKIVAKLRQWLQGADKEQLRQMANLGCDAAGKLIEKGQKDLAKKLGPEKAPPAGS